jgi:anti-sigma regulatory factor (Ser/Thr protein kinase)/predicted ArsR family transcriptional regulator
MDWMAMGDDVSIVPVLRGEIMGYVRRHCAVDSDVDGAEVVISELVTNAVRHAAGPIWAAIDWSSERPVLRIADLGPGFDLHAELPPADSIGGRGLFIVSRMAHQLEAHRRRTGGSIVSVVLPVERAVSVSIDPPRRRMNALPSLDEASPTGAFAREPFLRALVVQLAMTVNDQHGPAAAERAVAQVAADVGGQMESEYRRATGIDGRLTTEQIAECYVRLKGAIDGGFSVVEVTEQRIVLVNDRCPFGDAVQRAPSLCRMTSSVFGGIAARNADSGADVTLEERIAVGDHRCRVVVDFDPPSDVPTPWAHRYRNPT